MLLKRRKIKITDEQVIKTFYAIVNLKENENLLNEGKVAYELYIETINNKTGLKGHAILLDDFKVKVIEEGIEGTEEKVIDLKELNDNYTFTLEKEYINKDINI